MKAVAGNLYVTTDDGSYGHKGMVTEVIKDLVNNQGKKYDVCVAIGPMIMMKFVCLLTKELAVNFDEAMKRQQMYKTEEGRALLKLREGDTHHGGCGNCSE